MTDDEVLARLGVRRLPLTLDDLREIHEEQGSIVVRAVHG